MAYCSRCGSELADSTSVCPKCASENSGSSSGSGAGDIGLEENIASLLCYVGLWVTGLIFFFIDKRPKVRFHAAQSIVVFGGLQILYIVLTEVFFSIFRFNSLYSFEGTLIRLLQLVGLVLWILLMVKAYQGEKFKIPVAADIAESIASKQV